MELKKGHPLTFKAEFILMLEFELPEYFNLNLESDNDDEKHDEISQALLKLTDKEIPDEMIEQEMELTGIRPNKSNVENWETAKSRVALLLILRQIAE